MPKARNECVLLHENRGPVAVLTLNRPEARNCLSEALLVSLDEAFERLSGEKGIRAVVLTGAPSAFCSGHDLKELAAHHDDADGGKAYYAHVFSLCGQMMQRITACPKPVIAAVSGIASAAGCQLVAACDLAISAPDVTFSTPGVNIGLFCSTPAVTLSRNVARKHAAEMLFTGELIGAERAAAMGLINRVVPGAKLMGEAMALANHIASKSQEAMEIGKRALYGQMGMPLAEAYARNSAIMAENMLMADAVEGISAFVDKRTPRWPSA
jgi:enoyl-CoA hydratase/carnithine racemase